MDIESQRDFLGKEADRFARLLAPSTYNSGL